MSVFIRTGRNWGVGLPWWVVVWILPFYFAWLMLVLTWDTLVLTWMLFVWLYKAAAWVVREVRSSLDHH